MSSSPLMGPKMNQFDLSTATYLNGYWYDDAGNRITENQYFQLLSASTWDEIDPNDLLDDPGQIPYEETLSEEAFAEYVMGINL